MKTRIKQHSKRGKRYRFYFWSCRGLMHVLLLLVFQEVWTDVYYALHYHKFSWRVVAFEVAFDIVVFTVYLVFVVKRILVRQRA